MNRGTGALRTDGGEDDDTPLQELVAGVVIAAILLVAFGLLALDVAFFWVAFPVGFAGVLPAALALTKLYEQRRQRREREETPADADVSDERADALAVLRGRYARGELDEEEFEHRLERLLETERVADAKAHVEREKRRAERETERVEER
ncbi:Short C-terminal domain-containing protein [Halogranum gelatinilyticum]|uniref:Short C-terminal domain-containing protein n=1 Tax=Halogranum gelatinilyticum TaxID=660521 RepID=A0A1G9QC65_9EURY|nr:SHOCT domain-containing protein [Halogranum gelatinilyticum]SDM08569.1 Short C-terminal domain-containing protein [Halogranum gelatinilyticum]